MNPVNLLPAKHRPRTPTGGHKGGAYVVIGVLGAVFVMALLYVLTVNGINSRKSEVASAQAATAGARARAASLSGYGDFSKVKDERVQAVKQLAQGRIDWERLSRGLAHVLPAGVWLLTANASANGQLSASSNGSAPAAQTSAGSNPAVEVTGCARSQSQVAVTLVRLRELAGAKDVQLNDSSQPEAPAASPGGPAAGAGDSAGATGGCGQTHKHMNFKFDATVTFNAAPVTTPGSKAVPASLGGGS